MRYGLFADAHSNLEASKAVVEDAKLQSLNEWFFLGDIVGYYTNPNEVMDLFFDIIPESHFLIGNHDKAVANVIKFKKENGKTPRAEHFNPLAEEAVRWNAEHLSEKNLKRLENLLLSNRYLISSQDTTKNLVFAHSTPFNPELMNYIQGRLDAQSTFFEKSYLSDNTLAFVGHTHVPQAYLNNKGAITCFDANLIAQCPIICNLNEYQSALFSIPSVGQPRDSRPEAGYAILDTEKHYVQFKRLSYDFKETQRKAREEDLPKDLRLD
jgi:predicted phosphodiesterase